MAQKIGQARKAKLSIPKPRVGNKQAVGGIGKLAQRKALPSAPSAPSVATSTAQPSNTVPQTQSEPINPLQVASAPAGKVGFGNFTVDAAWSGAPGTDPRDATYWDAVSKLAFTNSQEYAKSEREKQRSDTDYNAAVAEALRGRLGQQRELGENAIRGNLGASGWLNRNEAEQTEAYTQARAHAQKNKEEEDFDRAAGMQALLGQFGIESGSILRDALGRWTEGRQQEAGEGEGEFLPPAPGAPPRPNTRVGSALATPKRPIQAKAFAQLIQSSNKKKKGKK